MQKDGKGEGRGRRRCGEEGSKCRGGGVEAEVREHVDHVVARDLAVIVAVQDLEAFAHFTDLGGGKLRNEVGVGERGAGAWKGLRGADGGRARGCGRSGGIVVRGGEVGGRGWRGGRYGGLMEFEGGGERGVGLLRRGERGVRFCGGDGAESGCGRGRRGGGFGAPKGRGPRGAKGEGRRFICWWMRLCES